MAPGSRPPSRQSSRRSGPSGISTPIDDVETISQSRFTRVSRSQAATPPVSVEIKVEKDIKVTKSGRGISSLLIC